MDDERQRQVARNQTLLQEVNEGIERGLPPKQEPDRVRFRCECARVDCNETVELTVREYGHVREDPRRFVLAAGHELREIETIVANGPGYVVVQKREVAGATAEELDPRS